MDTALVLEVLQLVASIVYLWLVAVYKAVVPVAWQRKKDMSGDTVLVTGAGSGLGRLMSIKFASLGCRLVLWDISEAGNQETLKQVKATGAKVTAYTVDLSDRAAIYATAEKVKSEVGDVDVLVNNAGIVTGKKFMECPDSLIQKTMDVNTSAHFWTCKSFLPGMMDRNHGHVVSIASSAGLFGVATLADYCSSKFGAVGFNDSVRAELAKFNKTGVHTTVVCPYFISTGMFEGAKSRFPAILDLLEPEYAVQKIMEAVRTNQTMLIMPRVLYVVYLLRGIFPTTVAEKVEKFMGVGNSMDDFTGGRSKTKGE